MYNTTFDTPSGFGELFAFLAIFAIIFIFIGLVAYIIGGITYSKLARKAGLPNPWLAWVPYGITYLTLKMTKLPLWLMVLPAVGFVLSMSDGLLSGILSFLFLIAQWVIIIIWDSKLLEAFGENKSIAYLHLLPGLGSLIVFGFIMKAAFGKNEYLLNDDAHPGEDTSMYQEPVSGTDSE